MRLSPEETFLLLSCRPHLDAKEDALLSKVVDAGVDWSFILWRAETYQTIPLCLHHLRRLTLTSQCPEWAVAYMHFWSEFSKARTAVQFELLGEVLNHFDKTEIEYYVFKGPLFASLIYPDPSLRPMQDLDIMVRPKDIRRAQKELYALGYKHGVFDPSTGKFTHMFRRITPATLEHKYAIHSVTRVKEIRLDFDTGMVAPEWRRRQIKSFVRENGDVLMPTFIDMHFNLAAGIAESDVWRGAQRRRVLGQNIGCQSFTTALWFTAARVYYEAFQHGTLKLQMVGDIDALIQAFGDEIDWAELVATSQKYDLGAALFHVLFEMKAQFDTAIPDAALAYLMPNQTRNPDPGDFGGILPKLLSKTVVTELQYSH